MKKTTLEILQEAREWLSDPEHWCQRERWSISGKNCALGAIERAHGRKIPAGMTYPAEFQPSIDRLIAAAFCLGPGFAPGFAPGLVAVLQINDDSSLSFANQLGNHRAVLAMFDLAIAAEQAAMDQTAKELVEAN
jgi:hypothetical protein